jgi:hypothetical protein
MDTQPHYPFFFSQLCPNNVNKPEYGQFYISYSAEVPKEWLEHQSDQGCLIEVIL